MTSCRKPWVLRQLHRPSRRKSKSSVQVTFQIARSSLTLSRNVQLLKLVFLSASFSLIRRPIKPKQIGRAPILGRPRLFGGKLLDYIQVTQQHVPLIISSCVSAINRLGLHNQVSGAS